MGDCFLADIVNCNGKLLSFIRGKLFDDTDIPRRSKHRGGLVAPYAPLRCPTLKSPPAPPPPSHGYSDSRQQLQGRRRSELRGRSLPEHPRCRCPRHEFRPGTWWKTVGCWAMFCDKVVVGMTHISQKAWFSTTMPRCRHLWEGASGSGVPLEPFPFGGFSPEKVSGHWVKVSSWFNWTKAAKDGPLCGVKPLSSGRDCELFQHLES